MTHRDDHIYGEDRYRLTAAERYRQERAKWQRINKQRYELRKRMRTVDDGDK